jgi:hypothetical protein
MQSHTFALTECVFIGVLRFTCSKLSPCPFNSTDLLRKIEDGRWLEASERIAARDSTQRAMISLLHYCTPKKWRDYNHRITTTVAVTPMDVYGGRRTGRSPLHTERTRKRWVRGTGWT